MNIFEIDDSETTRKTISQEDWMDKLDKIKISKQDMNKLIMNFFLVEGKKNIYFLNNKF